MSDKLQPYEISLWDDILVEENGKTYYKEVKIATIGSNMMTAPSRAINPVFTSNVNGEITLTFSIVHRYYDDLEDGYVYNPFEKYLVNERKVKLFYDNKWYDFIIKSCEESSDSNTFDFTAKGLFVNELGKVGYSIVLSNDLKNNQGTIFELAEKAVKGTDWVIDKENSDIIQQFVAEPLYIYKVTGSNFEATELLEKKPVTVEVDEIVYLFYSTIANSQTSNVFFLRDVDFKDSTLDDNNVAEMPNYGFLKDITFNENDPTQIDTDGASLIRQTENNPTGVNSKFQGYRLAYNQLTGYDTVKDRPVTMYKATYEDGSEKTIYKYTDYEYVTSDVVTSFITDGSGFNLYGTEGGNGLGGWSNVVAPTETHGDAAVLQPMKLVTYPDIGKKTIVELSKMNGIRSYLRIQFKGVGGPGAEYKNMIYNSGIDDYRSTIGSFSKGEEYVFRIAYGTAAEDGVRPLAEHLGHVRAVVAKFKTEPSKIWVEDVDDETGEVTGKEETAYVRTIDPDNILFKFDGPFEKKNNIITGGTFGKDDSGKYVIYYQDGISVTPSVDYVYVEEVEGGNNIECIWDSDVEVPYFKVKTNDDKTFLDYYYTTAKCLRAVSNTELSESGDDYGIFLYADSSELVGISTYIKEVQLFKAKRDGDNELVLIGNVPKATSLATDYYYLKPEEGQVDPDSIETYSSIESIADSIAVTEDDIKPVYNENYEKISSIEASQSNCFNIIQDLCEAFECWAKFTIDHEENGAIKLDADGAPSKKISFHKYIGDNNFAGFKYGINLQSIQRTVDSDEFVSKLIVEQVENDTVDGGIVSIAGAPSNPSGEFYILNMAYYLNQGLIENPDQYYSDYNNFIAKLKEKNLSYVAQKTRLQLATMARTKANKNNNVYQELIDEARNDYTESLLEFSDLTGLDYTKYTEDNGYSITFNLLSNTIVGTFSKLVRSIVPSFFGADGEEILFEFNENQDIDRGEFVDRTFYLASGEPRSVQDIAFICIVGKVRGFDIPTYTGSYTDYVDKFLDMVDLLSQTTKYIWEIKTPFNSPTAQQQKTLKINILPNQDNETLINLVGKLYTDQQVIKNYEPLLDTAKKEKKELDLLIDGTKNYALTVSTFKKTIDGVEITSTKEYLDDYVEGLKFTLKSESGSWDVEPTNIEKSFSQDELYTSIYFTQYPSNYKLKYILNGKAYTTEYPITLPLTEGATKVFTLVPIEEQKGITDDMEQILNEKGEIEKEFYKKYSRFIQEGTWTSQDYIDDELYYLDALNISRVSGQPKVSYNLAVYEISEQEGLQNYKFNVGDKTYIEDTQFFGYKHNIASGKTVTFTATDGFIKLPLGTVGVSQVGRDYDHLVHFTYDPSQNTIQIAEGEYISGQEDFIVTIDYEILTPIQEEVVVSEVEWHLDNPSENSITIQNYKTQFEDLFSRMAAAVQSVEYNSASYSRAASILDENGSINAGLLLKSLNELAGGFLLSGDGTITTAPDGIIIKDTTNTTRQIKLAGTGLKTSTDDGYNWDTIITADGLNIDTIDTQNVVIKDGDNPSFRWDTYGLNAYGYGDRIDLKTYVRFDKYGLYGIQNGENFQATSLDDVKDKAQFGLLWDGFFIKNSYTDGYVSISSDEDFQVVANNQERIKIGALAQRADGGYEYGIRIRNANGEPVFVTDDSGDIEMTGIVNARGGTFTDEVQVGSSDNSIILRGTANDAIIGSSQYFSDTSKGWAIKSDGDAIFNNITARGAIKTAVFEYSEIEAVGGIFMFRPSSTIREARIPTTTTYEYIKVVPEGESPEDYEIFEDVEYYTFDGTDYTLVNNPTIEDINLYYRLSDDETITYSDDLLVKVENPLLFSIGDWCKVSNYTPENPTSALVANGLVNIYEITDITNSKLTLSGGAHMFDDTINPTIVIDDDEIQAIGSNNVYGLTDVTDPQTPHLMENLTEKYFYDILIIEDNEEVEYATGVPSTLVFTNGNVDYPVTYIGNLSLWSGDEEYNTGETYLFATINNITYLYVGDGNELYDAGGNNENANFLIKKSFELGYEVDSLVGGALISFGNYRTSLPTPQLSNNYGIGINSSDSAVNLPARAISLFETEIYPNEDVKVGYKFKGILGTLPALGSEYMSPAMEYYMAGTQGIYTNNMYIGDGEKYLAFYTYIDDQGNEQRTLRLVADQFIQRGDDRDIDLSDTIAVQEIQYTVSTSAEFNTGVTWYTEMPLIQDGEYLWQRTYTLKTNGRIEYTPNENGFYVETSSSGMPGPPGPPGEDAVVLDIDSSNGIIFRNNLESTVLTVIVRYGVNNITSQNDLINAFGSTAHLSWQFRDDEHDWTDLSPEDTRLGNNGFTLTLTPNDIKEKIIFNCLLIVN